MFENKELVRFYTDIQEDIKSSLLAEEEGANSEQIFTDIALTMLSDSGETENFRTCYDEKLSKRGAEHKVNAYALYENYATLDLFYNNLIRWIPMLCLLQKQRQIKYWLNYLSSFLILLTNYM